MDRHETENTMRATGTVYLRAGTNQFLATIIDGQLTTMSLALTIPSRAKTLATLWVAPIGTSLRLFTSTHTTSII